MVVVQIKTGSRSMERSGITSGTRTVAMKLWRENRPERPLPDLVRKLNDAGNRGRTEPSGSQDIPFAQSKDGTTLYAIVLDIPPDGKVTIKSLALNAKNWVGQISSVKLVRGNHWFGDEPLKFTRAGNGLHVTLPEKFDGKTAFALKIRA